MNRSRISGAGWGLVAVGFALGCVAVALFASITQQHQQHQRQLDVDLDATPGREGGPAAAAVGVQAAVVTKERRQVIDDWRKANSIPCIIHQTWKDEESIPPVSRAKMERWQDLNPECSYKFYTDEDVERHIAMAHPELHAAWARMLPIHKADLFRYVILHDVGGYYADIDVNPMQPVRDWARVYDVYGTRLSLITGMEAVSQGDDYVGSFARQYQFCQWTIAAAPGHSVLKRAIATIRDTFETRDDAHINIVNPVRLTGPAVWSDAMLAEIEQRTGAEYGNGNLQYDSVKNDHFLFEDMLVLPLRAFSVGSAGYTPAASHRLAQQLVLHGFQGSWKAALQERKRKESQDSAT